MLQVSNIGLRLGGQEILHDVSLGLKKGGTLALVGESGCGKTSLLRVIAGLEHPYSGSIVVNDRQLNAAGVYVEPANRGVGLVFQDFALFPHINVRRNILFGLNRLSSQEQNDRLSAMLSLFQLEGLANRYPHQLSGGQQQRVAMARALAPKPDLLLLDEPFSGYDVLLRDSVRRELRELLDKAGITTVLVTHDLQDALVMADEVCIMQHGRVLQQGSVMRLAQHPVNDYVARFMGGVNSLKVQCIDGQWISAFGPLPGLSLKLAKEALLVFPPDALRLAVAGEPDAFKVRIGRLMPDQHGYLVWCMPETGSESIISAKLPEAPSGSIQLSLLYDKVHLFPL